jgi:hypothetical protein
MFMFELIPANHQNMVSQALPGLRARLIIRSGAVLGGRQEPDVRRWYPLLWVLSRWKGSVGYRAESEFLGLRQVFCLWALLSRASQPAAGMLRPFRLAQSQNTKPQRRSQFSDGLFGFVAFGYLKPAPS